MRSESETIEMKSTEEYRNEVTVHLVRITGELAHIREKVEANYEHLEKINGRLRFAENSISAIKAIGTTITVVLTIAIGLVGVLA